LRFNEEATLRENIIPFATIYWDDEHPSGIPHPRCGKKQCFQSVSLLIVARCEYWEQHEISAKYANVWETAQKLIPKWPGFRRLNPSEEERARIEVCLQSAENWFTALDEFSNGKIEFRETDSGIAEWSATIDLKSDKQESNSPKS
jgi:hypothetical protein